jgi:hypothetical protein
LEAFELLGSSLIYIQLTLHEYSLLICSDELR